MIIYFNSGYIYKKKLSSNVHYFKCSSLALTRASSYNRSFNYFISALLAEMFSVSSKKNIILLNYL
jgi:hypothetical protein